MAKIQLLLTAIVTIQLFLPIKPAKKVNEVWERLTSQKNRLSNFVNQISIKHLQVDRKLFAIDRSLDHETNIFEQRGRFLSDKGRAKLLERLDQMEEWCSQAKHGLESSAQSLEESIFEIYKTLRTNGLMPKKYTGQAPLPTPGAKDWKEKFRELTTTERERLLARFSSQLGAILRRQKELEQLEEVQAEIDKIDEKINLEKKAIQLLDRRKSINKKSLIIVQKTKVIEAKIKALQEEKIQFESQASEQDTTLSEIKIAKEKIESDKKTLRVQLAEMMAEHKKLPTERRKPTVSVDQLPAEQVKIVRESLELLAKAKSIKESTQSILERLTTALSKCSKLSGQIKL